MLCVLALAAVLARTWARTENLRAKSRLLLYSCLSNLAILLVFGALTPVLESSIPLTPDPSCKEQQVAP